MGPQRTVPAWELPGKQLWSESQDPCPLAPRARVMKVYH